MSEEDFNVVEKMSKHGGSFVKALAEACHHADNNNLEKIKTAFADYWEEYKNF